MKKLLAVIVRGQIIGITPVSPEHVFGNRENCFHVEVELLKRIPEQYDLPYVRPDTRGPLPKRAEKEPSAKKPVFSGMKGHSARVLKSRKALAANHDKILREYELGRTPLGIAHELGVSPATVSGYLSQQGVKLRSKRESREANKRWKAHIEGN